MQIQSGRTVPLKELKKNFFEIRRKGYQKKRNFALISKCVELLLRQEVPKDFFSEKQNKSLKIQFFCKHFFPFCQTQDFCTFLKSAQNSASFDTLYAQFRRIFFNFYKGIKGPIR
jgi:hypothetical protein